MQSASPLEDGPCSSQSERRKDGIRNDRKPELLDAETEIARTSADYHSNEVEKQIGTDEDRHDDSADLQGRHQ